MGAGEPEEGDGDSDIDMPDAPTVNDVIDGDDQVTGEGIPGAIIEIKDEDGNVIGTGTVDSDGNFIVELNKPVSEGDKLEITQSIKNDAGETVESDSIYVTVKANDSSNVIVGDDDASDKGDKLPDTATSTFNWLLGGLMAMFAGMAGLFTRRKQKTTKND